MKTHILACSLLLLACPLSAETLLADFSKPTPRWNATHSISNAAVTAEGLSFTVTEEDPWLLGPKMDFPAAPAGTRRVRFALTCAPTDCKSSWQLFYSFGGQGYNEGASCRLAPLGKPPHTRFEAEIPFSEVKPGPCKFRIDPPDVKRSFTAKTFTCEFQAPLWTFKPQTPPPLVIPASTPLVLKGKDWELRHDPDRIGAFRFLSRGKIVDNNPEEPFVYLDASGAARTLDWSQAKMSVKRRRGTELQTTAELTDAEGRFWRLIRWFTPQDRGRALTISTQISCRPATVQTATDLLTNSVSILHIPFLTLFIDRASQGHKHQALLAGVEYLDDEPSSNEKDIRTIEHNRLIPAEYRLSAPLAVFTDKHNWLAAAWNQLSVGISGSPKKPGPHAIATVFDTPDRLFRSGGHLLAFWAPAVGPARRESELDVYKPTPFRAATHVVTLRTGEGASIAEALEGVLPSREETLPPPDEISDTAALELLARGWLDSEIRNGEQVRHAVPFAWGRPSDAPVLMQYLAAELSRRPDADATLAPRLRETARSILAKIPRTEVGWHGVSHIHHPVATLVAGDVANWLGGLDAQLKNLNCGLAAGKRIWKPQPKRPDFGETLGADHCNGFTAMEVDRLISYATWSGDEAEIAKALAIVDKATALYHGTVPRGAQPWEMPLHTPDIMASAHLTRIYARAHLLKPDPAYLREARHWAYTGLSMVYLVPPPFDFAPGTRPVGRYATCAVMGATHWQQPNWIGRPVQWCGLVYSSALWELANITSEASRQARTTAELSSPVDAAFWHKLAAGITASGMRQTHTAEDPQSIGLLPDSWNLEAQNRYPVPINPGTVQENLAESIGRPYYALRRLANGSLIHVPGTATSLSGTELRCRIEGWPEAPFKVVVTRLDKPSAVTFNGKPVEYVHDAAHRALIVTLPARAVGDLAIRLGD